MRLLPLSATRRFATVGGGVVPVIGMVTIAEPTPDSVSLTLTIAVPDDCPFSAAVAPLGVRDAVVVGCSVHWKLAGAVKTRLRLLSFAEAVSVTVAPPATAVGFAGVIVTDVMVLFIT